MNKRQTFRVFRKGLKTSLHFSLLKIKSRSRKVLHQQKLLNKALTAPRSAWLRMHKILHETKPSVFFFQAGISNTQCATRQIIKYVSVSGWRIYMQDGARTLCTYSAQLQTGRNAHLGDPTLGIWPHISPNYKHARINSIHEHTCVPGVDLCPGYNNEVSTTPDPVFCFMSPLLAKPRHFLRPRPKCVYILHSWRCAFTGLGPNCFPLLETPP